MFKNQNLAIAFHVILGIVFLFFKQSTTIFSYVALLYFLKEIWTTKNSNDIASIAICYLGSFDIVNRINYSSGSSYEFSKYAIILICILCFVIEKKINYFSNKTFLVYLLALMPALFLVDFYHDFASARAEVLTTISGPVVIGFSVLYFINRKITLEFFAELLRFSMLPIICLSILILGNIPDLATYSFNLAANTDFSAGFGTNQVCTQLGYGFMILIVSLIVRVKVFYSYTINIILSGIWIILALLTFSRGGVIVPLMVIFVVLLLYSALVNNFAKLRNLFLIILLSGVSLVFLWFFLNQVTNNQLEKRYEKAFKKKKLKDVEDENSITAKINLSNREYILAADLQIFVENPIAGVGISMSKIDRQRILGYETAAHTEFTRLLCEHGLFGLINLFIIIVVPIQYFLKLHNGYQKIFFSVLMIFSISTLFHSSTRIALPTFCYGFAFVNLIPNRNKSLKNVIT